MIRRPDYLSPRPAYIKSHGNSLLSLLLSVVVNRKERIHARLGQPDEPYEAHLITATTDGPRTELLNPHPDWRGS